MCANSVNVSLSCHNIAKLNQQTTFPLDHHVRCVAACITAWTMVLTAAMAPQPE